MENVRLIRWNQQHSPSEPQLRALMQQKNLTPYAWSNGPGDEYPPHSHSYNKVIYVAAGSIVWILPATAEQIEMQPGDRLELPHDVVHAARVGPKGVTCLEAHC